MKVGVLFAAVSMAASVSAFAASPSLAPHRQAQEVIIPPSVTLVAVHAKPSEIVIPHSNKVGSDSWAIPNEIVIPHATQRVNPNEIVIPLATPSVKPNEIVIPH